MNNNIRCTKYLVDFSFIYKITLCINNSITCLYYDCCPKQVTSSWFSSFKSFIWRELAQLS
jgi:hypothetical protein